MEVFVAHSRGVGAECRGATALHGQPSAAHRERAVGGPVRFRPAAGAGTREGVMRCPYHGPMTTRSRDRAIPAPPRPFGLRLPLLLLLLVLLFLAARCPTPQLRRASCRVRLCQSWLIFVFAVVIIII